MMAGTIKDMFGYDAGDKSAQAAEAAARLDCPFINSACGKTLSDGTISGVCAVRQTKDTTPVICCPNRLYANDYRLLRIVAERSFGVSLEMASGRQAVAVARSNDGAVAVFGHGWGGELRLPKREGSGNYFADWVLALLDGNGDIQEFTSIEVQTIDTTGNYRASRDGLLSPSRDIIKSSVGLNWENVSKRIIPQLVYKGQVLQREPLCRTGLWFVTPETVYRRIITRLGGEGNMTFGYTPQPGALHFLRLDYDQSHEDGKPDGLQVVGEEITTVEKVQQAFSNVSLPTPGVYGEALKEALYGTAKVNYSAVKF